MQTVSERLSQRVLDNYSNIVSGVNEVASVERDLQARSCLNRSLIRRRSNAEAGGPPGGPSRQTVAKKSQAGRHIRSSAASETPDEEQSSRHTFWKGPLGARASVYM